MAGLQDFAFSLELRDIIRELVEEEIDKQRPRYRYAVVSTIDRPNRKCDVVYTGDVDPVTVSMGSLQPATTGQRVRIEGIGTDKYIADVIGDRWNDPTKQPKSTSGSVTITPSAANTPTTVAVTFPVGFFSAAPRVFVSLQSQAPGTEVTGISFKNVTASGFDAVITRTNTSGTTLTWIAFEI